MKKGVIRDIFHVIISMVVFIAIIGIFLFIGSEVAYADNSSTAQTVYLQKVLGADGSYRQSNFGRLQHNGDEPIYVSIEKDAFTEQQTTTIGCALDYIFGLVGEINAKYQYKLVDDVQTSQYLGKSRIFFETGNLDDALGCTERKSSIFGFGSKGVFNQDCRVVYDEESLDEDHFYYTTLHELLHVFGLDDVYGKNQFQSLNTYMNIFTNDDLKMITPNDYKLLLACYAEDLSTLNENEKDAYIDLLQQKVEDYSIAYFTNYSQQRKAVKTQGWLDCGFTLETAQKIYNYNVSEEKLDLTFGVCLTQNGQQVRVEIEDGKYRLTTYDKNGVLLETCCGNCFNIEGEIFLQGVHLQHFKDGKETFADLNIFLPRNDSNGFHLYDLFNNFYSNNGVSTQN